MPRFDWKMKAKVDGRNVAGVLSMSYEAGPAYIATFFEAVSGSTCERNLAFSKIVSELVPRYAHARTVSRTDPVSTPPLQPSWAPSRCSWRPGRTMRCRSGPCPSSHPRRRARSTRR